MTDAQAESAWARGLRDAGRALTSWSLGIAGSIGVAAAAVLLGPLGALAVALGIPAAVLAFHVLRAPVRQRNELRQARQGAESDDTEAFTIVRVLQDESVHILGHEFSLAAVLLALEGELARGWALGTFGDWTTLRERLGIADAPEQAVDGGLSPLDVAGCLRIAGVVEFQHLQRGSGPWPLGPGPPASHIASLSAVGVRVIRILRTEGIAPERN